MRAVVIAIDGPAGSGKSTLARRVADSLALPHVNTGLMFRAVTLEALREGVAPDDGPELARLAQRIGFDLDPSLHPPELRIDGSAPEEALTAPEVESRVSQVSGHPEVRRILRAEQRRLGEAGAVMEGRDIGSVVFPDATLKILLEAHPRERAARRAEERDTGRTLEVGLAIAARDARDAGNVPPVDADLVIDTTELDADAVLELAMAAIREALGDDP
jgi:cytidylate kinase